MILGVHYIQRDDLFNGKKVHPDTIRCNATKAICQLSVFGVGGSRTEKDKVALQGDIRRRTTWGPRDTGRGGVSDTIMDRRCKVVILDYYWLQRSYFDSLSNTNRNGYGNAWVSEIIPTAFKAGLKVAILPNDRWGYVKEMAGDETGNLRKAGGKYAHMTVQQAMRYNPLFRATEAAVASEAWSPSIKDDQAHRTNLSATVQYLHQTSPFLVFYNTKEGLASYDDALAYLESDVLAK